MIAVGGNESLRSVCQAHLTSLQALEAARRTQTENEAKARQLVMQVKI
jgi:hypothetical protein